VIIGKLIPAGSGLEARVKARQERLALAEAQAEARAWLESGESIPGFGEGEGGFGDLPGEFPGLGDLPGIESLLQEGEGGDANGDGDGAGEPAGEAESVATGDILDTSPPEA
jgi:hypothetical protein